MIVCFEAETIPWDMSPAVEYFEFEDSTIAAIIEECLQEWALDPFIDETTAIWYKVEISDRFMKE